MKSELACKGLVVKMIPTYQQPYQTVTAGQIGFCNAARTDISWSYGQGGKELGSEITSSCARRRGWPPTNSA